MTFVTSERTAKEKLVRVFKPMVARFKDIDERTQKVLNNSPSKMEFVKNAYESESVHLYLTEMQINTQRYALEVNRLRNLVKQEIEHEKAVREKRGDPLDFDEREVCPTLYDIAMREQEIDAIKNQIKTSKLMELIDQTASRGKIENYEKLLETFKKKREAFAPKDLPDLVN